MNINDQGRVVVKPPYQIPDVVYTLISNASLSGLLDMGLDIYTLVYKPAGYTITQFNDILAKKPVISVLRSSSGKVEYVPKDAILGSDELFEPYREVGVLVNIGPTHKDESLESLKDSIIQTVKSSMGTTAAISIEDISTLIPVPRNEHQLLVKEREHIKNTTGSLEKLLANALDHNILLKAQLQALLDFIQHYLKSCCGKDVCLELEKTEIIKTWYRHQLSYYVMETGVHTPATITGSGANPFVGTLNSFEEYLRWWHWGEAI